ncbi:glycosyltransferase family 2 protein, partial [Rosenbergiella metrosideri]|uniref:glycosyltransferase family 2 protein n=1 Tax=Rosenbergiella metrosideri TaxID=2921185 RepID=UPI001F4F8C1C
MATENKIAILLCTYNGEKYLREQLDSIIYQSYKNWVIYASDDGSADDTITILNEYQLKIGKEKLVILSGPKKGFAWNFISSLQHNGEGFEYFAFCDQDDIWHHNKLERAVEFVYSTERDPFKECLLYGARTFLVDDTGRSIGKSNLFRRKFSLNNALVQSYAGGNTMLISNALREKVKLLPSNLEVVSHDWLLYIYCTALDGEVMYDREPCLYYRQHGHNLVGSNRTLESKIKRLKKLYKGDVKTWNNINEKNIEVLDGIS